MSLNNQHIPQASSIPKLCCIAGNEDQYYRHRCYHPLVASLAETGDLAGMWLRKGNASSASGASKFTLPILDRLEQSKAIGQVVDVRFDAAFADPALMDRLDERGVRFVARVKSNSRLEELAAPHLARPVDRPPLHRREWCCELTYRAGSWPRARRVVLVIVDDPKDRFLEKVHLRHYFLVTSHTREQMRASELVAFYRKRGTFESMIDEFKSTMEPKLSSPRRQENAVTLSLYAIAYQWMHLLRVFHDGAKGRSDGAGRRRKPMRSVLSCRSRRRRGRRWRRFGARY